jgi:hypothetical protein
VFARCQSTRPADAGCAGGLRQGRRDSERGHVSGQRAVAVRPVAVTPIMANVSPLVWHAASGRQFVDNEINDRQTK